MPGVSRRDKPLKASGSFEELSDVGFSGLATGDLLVYDGGSWGNTKSLTGDYDITGTLDVDDLIVDNDLAVAGAFSAAGAASLGGTLQVDGATTLVGAATLQSTLDVTDAATFLDTLSVAGALSGAGFSFSGDGSVGGDLAVTGAITADSLSIAGNLDVPGDLVVTGVAAFGDDVGILGNLSVSGSFAAGTLSTTGNFTAGGEGFFQDRVTVRGSSDTEFLLNHLGGGSARLFLEAFSDSITLENQTEGGFLYLEATQTGGSSVLGLRMDPNDYLSLRHPALNRDVLRSDDRGIRVYDADGSDPRIQLYHDDASTLAASFGAVEGFGLFVTSNIASEPITVQGANSGGVLETLLKATPDGSVDLYYDGVQAAATTINGLDVYAPDADDAEVRLRNTSGVRTRFVWDEGLQTAAIFNNVNSASVGLWGLDSGGTFTRMVQADPDGSVDLYYDGNLAFATQSFGATLEAPSGTDSALIFRNSSADVGQVYTLSSNFLLRTLTDGGLIRLFADDTGGTPSEVFRGDPDGSAYLYYDGSVAAQTSALGIDVYEAGREAIRLEGVSASARNQINSRGAGYQLRIFGEPTGGGSNLMALFDPDGSTNLYYAGARSLSGQSDHTRIYSTVSDNPYLAFYQDNATTRNGFVQFVGGGAATVDNESQGGTIVLRGEQTGGGSANVLIGDPDGPVTLYNDGSPAGGTNIRGMFVRDAGGGDTRLLLEDSGGSAVGLLWHSPTQLNLYQFLHGLNISLQSEDAGGVAQLLFRADPDGSADLFYDGVEEFRTADSNATDYLSGAEVKDYGGTWRQVGFADQESIGVTSSRNLADDDWAGKRLRITSGTVTLTAINESTVANGMQLDIVNVSGNNATISPGSGVTLTWLDGSGGATGTRTLADGSICTLWKISDTSYYVFGNGLS